MIISAWSFSVGLIILSVQALFLLCLFPTLSTWSNEVNHWLIYRFAFLSLADVLDKYTSAWRTRPVWRWLPRSSKPGARKKRCALLISRWKLKKKEIKKTCTTDMRVFPENGRPLLKSFYLQYWTTFLEMDIDERLGMRGILSALWCLLGYPNRTEVSCPSTALRVKLSSEIFKKLRACQTHSQTFH